MSYLSWPISQIATEIPGATAVLFQHKINFCSHGSKSLEEMLERKKLNQEVVIGALEELSGGRKQAINWRELGTSELIEHIQSDFHDVHRQQLSELQRLAERVEAVHRQHPLCPIGLANHLAQFGAVLEQHMQKEELVLFPMLSNKISPMVNGPISVMKSEHDHHMEDIEMIYGLTNDVTPHSGACNTWRALYLGLQEFIRDLNLHIHIENNILFERADNQS